MVRAYVLIEMVAGQSRNLVNSLNGQKRVVDVARVTGPYDVVAVLEGEDIEEVSSFVSETVHSLAGVVRTTTCAALT